MDENFTPLQPDSMLKPKRPSRVRSQKAPDYRAAQAEDHHRWKCAPPPRVQVIEVRALNSTAPAGEPMTSSAQVFPIVLAMIGDPQPLREHFIVIALDARHRLLWAETVSIGSLVASLVHPREVLQALIATSAAAFICAHNHPSGDPRHSPEDLAITRRLYEAGNLIGIALLDHIIVGAGDYISFVDRGLPPFDAPRAHAHDGAGIAKTDLPPNFIGIRRPR